MKRTFLAAALLMLLLTLPALAAEGGTYDVKYYATNPKDVYASIAEMEFPGVIANYPKPPATFITDMTASIAYGDEVRTVTINVVLPSFEVQQIPAISADSSYNQSAGALIDYAYKYRTLAQKSERYNSALGEAPVFELSRYSIGRDYDQLGKDYTLTQTYMEQVITQSLSVTPVSSEPPDVHVDENGAVRCTPDTVQYSIDRSSWSSIRSGAAIPSKCYGEYIYFRTPASAYADYSSSVRVYVREQQSNPTTKLELSATSFSVKVTNGSSFSNDCEFSIDGSNYSRKTEWTGLASNTRYTVYARYAGDSSYFASSPVTSSISTKEGSKNEVTYTKTSNAHTTYFLARGSAKLSVSSKVLSATYTDASVSKLKSDIKTAEKKMSAVTVLDVSMLQEDGDSRDFTKVKFTMPKDMGLLQLRLNTPYCTLIVDDESQNIEIETISKTVTTKGLKEFVAGKDVVYKVTTKGDGVIQILYPWEFPDRADLSGLCVDYSDVKFAQSSALRYQVVDAGILFTLPDDGYFSITNLKRSYGALPFADCQTHWAYSYIYYAYENGLVNGVSPTEFSPNTLVTRSQIAVLLARLAGADEASPYTSPYTDVPADAWYAGAVGYLYQQGALKDQGDGLFGPEESITREQMAALVAQVFPYSGTVWRPIDCKDRSQISTYALTAVDGLYNRNVFKGDDAGNFNPTGTLTRGEFATILYRLVTS